MAQNEIDLIVGSLISITLFMFSCTASLFLIHKELKSLNKNKSGDNQKQQS